MSTYWAVDLGATSGRVMSVRIESDRIRIEEEIRFVNEPINRGGHLCWDVETLWEQTLVGLQRAAERAGHAGETPLGIAVDSWGVDFALVDSIGGVVGDVHHYRSAARGAAERTERTVSRRELFRRTGVTPMDINTVFRLADAIAELDSDDDVTMLLIPDLWTFRLSGVMAAEITIAATTSLLDISRQQWDLALLGSLGIDAAVLPTLAASGSRAGSLVPIVAERIGISTDLAVMHTAGHDTAAAIAAIPGTGRIAFISCGTWALVGVETDLPVLSDEAFTDGFTNEIGFDGHVLFMRNLTGLWLLEQALRTWRHVDPTISLHPLLNRASTLVEFTSTVDVGAPALVHTVDVPAEVRRMCRETGQQEPRSAPETVRCILLSLAVAFRQSLRECERLTGIDVDEVHLVGGGTRNALLCQLVADVCGRVVVVGPAEATSLGNALVQAWGCGEIESAAHLRHLVRSSFQPVNYVPRSKQSTE